MYSDVKQTVRLLIRQPLLTSTLVLSLALGLGANTAVFTVVNGVLLNGLPYPEPDRIVHVQVGTYSGVPDAMFGWQMLRWRDSTKVLESFAGYTVRSTPTGRDAFTRVVTTADVTAEFFKVLGVAPALGRPLAAGDRGARAAVISHRLWTEQYGTEPAVVGSPVLVDGDVHTVVGVMPAGFEFPRGADVWTALSMNEDGIRVEHLAGGLVMRPARLHGIGRLHRAASVEELMREGSQTLSSRGVPTIVRASTLQEMLVGPVRPLLVVLQAGVLLLLALVCANVASLLLVRNEGRRHEYAVRLCLGIGRGRLVRQALIESAVLVGAGTAAGLLLAQWFTASFTQIAPPEVPRLDELGTDTRVFAFIASLSALTAVTCGALPARWAAGFTADGGMVRASSGQSRVTGSSGRMTRGLVITQIAVSLVLLTAALVVVEAVWRLTRIDAGFAARHTVTARLAIPSSLSARTAERLALFERLEEALAGLPGATAVALTNDLPFAGHDPRVLFQSAAPDAAGDGTQYEARWRIVGGRFFEAHGIRVVEGRPLDTRDGRTAAPTVAINRALALQQYPNGQAVGQTIRLENNITAQIVGVVEDTKEQSLLESPVPTIYFPLQQLIRYGAGSPLPVFWMDRPYILVTSSLPTQALITPLKHAVTTVNGNLVVDDIGGLMERVHRSVSRLRFAALLLTVLAVIAFSTAAGGLYALLAHWVTCRGPELGVRLALGATPASLQRLVVSEGISTMVVGVVLGLTAAWQVATFVPAIAPGIQQPRLLTVACASLLLVGAGALASWRPAVRAGRADPLHAIRSE